MTIVRVSLSPSSRSFRRRAISMPVSAGSSARAGALHEEIEGLDAQSA